MRKQLYLDIKEALKSIENNSEQVFKHFDLWNKQVQFIEQETPFQTPAVFIEFDTINWNQMGMRQQNADVTVRLHVVTKWYGKTADNSPIELNALKYLDLPDLINHKLMNYSPSSGNTFMRFQSIINHDHEKYLDSIEVYKCNVQDTSARNQYSQVSVTPVVNNQ